MHVTWWWVCMGALPCQCVIHLGGYTSLAAYSLAWTYTPKAVTNAGTQARWLCCFGGVRMLTVAVSAGVSISSGPCARHGGGCAWAHCCVRFQSPWRCGLAFTTSLIVSTARVIVNASMQARLLCWCGGVRDRPTAAYKPPEKQGCCASHFSNTHL
jgi:hypothetical protein